MSKHHKQPRVLIVDDEAAVCQSCAKTLAREGYQVEHALNGEQALAKIAAGAYDLVVSDLKMPKIDGMQLLKLVKQRWPQVNVIMITGYGCIRSAVEAMKLGAFDYITKPFTSEELATAAARALGLTQLQRDRQEPVASDIFQELSKRALDQMWCLSDHSWIKVLDDQRVEIGVDAVYRRLIGDIETVETAKLGQHLDQGETCAQFTVRLDSASSVRHNLRCPVSGIVMEINEAVLKNPALLTQRPYDLGWLVRLQSADLKENLDRLKPFRESIAGRVANKRLAGSPG